MAEKLLANASSKLTLEEKAKMEWIAKLEGKNSLSNLIRSMCKKKISEVEGEMAGKSSLEVIKNICTEMEKYHGVLPVMISWHFRKTFNY